jgi:cyclophilin family peptidyl-prolyl cis-trans isomerase
VRGARAAAAGVAIALAAVGVGGCGGQSGASATHAQTWSSPPAMALKPGASYSAVVTTNFGAFTISLFAAQDPVAVNNFVFLAQQHYYDGLRFFRVIKTFMVQTGDPNNNGTGGPGYRFGDELPPTVPYAPGVVAMANSGPNTNGSQFFVCTGQDCDTLPPSYTELGQVTSGMDVVQKIAALPTKANPLNPSEKSTPTRDAHMVSVAIAQTGG